MGTYICGDTIKIHGLMVNPGAVTPGKAKEQRPRKRGAGSFSCSAVFYFSKNMTWIYPKQKI